MFNITSLTIIFLLGITIIEYGSSYLSKEAAMEECENLMDGYLYETQSSNGRSNFETSYNKLTYNMIKEHFGREQPNEEQQGRRLLQGDLFSQYFLDLNTNHDMNIKRSTIQTWCKQQVINGFPNQLFNSAVYDVQETQCIKSVVEELQVDDTMHPNKIFNIFYNNYTLNGLTKDSDNASSSTQTLTGPRGNTITVNSKRPKPNYPRNFFAYYGENAKNPVLTQGFFRTIKEFCEFVGYKIVTDKAT